MSEAERPSRRVTLGQRADLVAVFDRSLIEFLEVSDQRAVTLLEGAIFLVEIDDGTLRDASELTVELWEPPRDESSTDAEELLTGFVTRIKELTNAET